jgi:hypothetical protein
VQVAEDEVLAVHQSVVAHLEACDDAMMMGEEGPEYGPYDGCLDCQAREALHAAWPMLGRLIATTLADSFAKDIERPYTGGEIARLLREFPWE